MSILADEPNIFPASLLQDTSELPAVVPSASTLRQWWGVYTKARQEKSVARSLLDQRIPFYLPLVRHNAVYHRRRVTATVPLFAGYVFLFGTDEERLATLATGRIVRMLRVEQPERFRSDLAQIQRLIASGAPLTMESRLAAGGRVRVKRGALAGLEGYILVRRGQTRLLVRVDFLQQGASVEIDDFLLEPIQ